MSRECVVRIVENNVTSRTVAKSRTFAKDWSVSPFANTTTQTFYWIVACVGKASVEESSKLS